MQTKGLARDFESWVSLFQPDVLASTQYYEKCYRRRYPDPEKMLMFAVLEDAIECFQKFSSARTIPGQARFEEVDDWFFHEKSDWLFSFETICEILNLNPTYIRTGLKRWQTGGAARPRGPKFRLFYVVRPHRRVRKAYRSTKKSRAMAETPQPDRNVIVQRQGERKALSALRAARAFSGPPPKDLDH